MKKGKLLIFSAPSGSGKTTLLNYVMSQIPEMAFSVSATTRQPRGNELDGREYFFLTKDDFKRRISRGEFLEWEEVYPGRYYGTLLSEVAKMQDKGKHVAFDVDVHGGVNIKNHYGNQALSVFIQTPSIEVLRNRLILRNTDSMEEIEKRVAKASSEIEFAQGKFDCTVINNDLSSAKSNILRIVKNFIDRNSRQ